MIVTNHTVTIAAELVSYDAISNFSMGANIPCYLCHQHDGQKLVGQCEISHPVPADVPAEIPDEEAPISPVDGLGEFTSPRQNMLFESVSKGSYEPLPSRIQRK